MNAEGSGQHRGVPNTDGGECPSWSPRWKRIAFNSNLTGDHVMYIVNVDGFGLVDLSSVGEGWQFDFCAPGLFVMRADGKGIEALPVDGIGETSLPGWR